MKQISQSKAKQITNPQRNGTPRMDYAFTKYRLSGHLSQTNTVSKLLNV